jgi:hypothetical protein
VVKIYSMEKLITFANNEAYLELLCDIKSKYSYMRIQSIRAVNRNLIDFYWWVGQQIVEKQEQYSWGDGVVE